MKLIDKDTLAAEIEKRIDKLHIYLDDERNQARSGELYSLEQYINTPEVKGVDLEEEIERVRKTHFINDDFEKATLEGRQITNIAKHFFELGLKAQKGE